MVVPYSYSTIQVPLWKEKLPKQWRQWCRKARLKPHGGQVTGRQQHEWFNLTGHGRVWRVNCYGIFQVGDKLADFDRWALCDPIVGMNLPQTEAEFLKTLNFMLDEIRNAEYLKWQL